MSECDKESKALIIERLKQRSRFSNKKFFQHLDQKCKSDFSWIPAVKWPLYNIFYLRHWNHQVKRSVQVNSFIEISYKVTTSLLVLYVIYETAVLLPSHIFLWQSLINVWCHDHRFSGPGVVVREAHCLENVWLKGAFALGFISTYCYYYQWSILL